jgi:hypothetical protein
VTVSELTTVLISTTSSVSLAALTSVCVTLVTPGSEARKERLMERYRARREIARQLRAVVFAAGQLSAETHAGMADAQRIKVVEAKAERRKSVIVAGQKIEDAIVDASLPRNVGAVVSHIAGRVQGIALSAKQEADVAAELNLYAGLCLDLYQLPRLTFKRRRGFRELKKILSS